MLQLKNRVGDCRGNNFGLDYLNVQVKTHMNEMIRLGVWIYE